MTHGRKAIDFYTCNAVTQMKKIILFLFLAIVLDLEHIFYKASSKILSHSYFISVCYSFAESWTNPHTILVR